MDEHCQIWTTMDKNKQNLVNGLGAGAKQNETRLVSKTLVHCNETAK